MDTKIYVYYTESFTYEGMRFILALAKQLVSENPFNPHRSIITHSDNQNEKNPKTNSGITKSILSFK